MTLGYMKPPLKKIFKKERNIVIGAVHFPPLIGYPSFPGVKTALRNALLDLQAFERNGVDGIIFENNYDQPHVEKVGSGTASAMAYLGGEMKKSSRLPMGVSTLWNDFETSLALARLLNLRFIRVPVFVDTVRASCGVIRGYPRKVVAYRRRLDAENVALFTDIHVKHAELLSRHSIVRSALEAVRRESDAIVLTGKWTGDAPNIEELKAVRAAFGDFPIILGSGVDAGNVRSLFKYANGAIVSTSLKAGEKKKGEVNVKSYGQRIDGRKVRKLLRAL